MKDTNVNEAIQQLSTVLAESGNTISEAYVLFLMEKLPHYLNFLSNTQTLQSGNERIYREKP